MTTILIKKKDTAGAPAPGDLTNAAGGTEIAVNTATKRIYTKDSGGNVVELGTNATSSTIDQLTVVTSTTLSYGTANQVQYLNASKLLVGSANLTFNGTTLTANTIGAFTLSGTIAGGGNQINNVIIGTSTPLAGSFTTLTASTSITNSSLTSGRVTYATTAGLLTDSANLLYSGTDLTVYGITVGRGAGAIATNTAVGASALATTNSGVGRNTAVGYAAMTSNTSGVNNTGLGQQALTLNTTGTDNTAVGYASLFLVTTGISNTAVGVGSLQNTTSNSNTAVGYQAATSNTSGSPNTAVGYQSLYTNTTGSNNTALGYYALRVNTNDNNTAVGHYAASGNTSGTRVIAVGGGTLTATNTGSSHVAIGHSALGANTSGGFNVAVGDSALGANTTASYNTAVGYQSQYTSSVGAQNTSVGYFTLQKNTASYNTAVGYYALYNNGTGTSNVAVGGGVGGSVLAAMENNTSGASNSAFGVGALGSNTTANNNTAIGYKAGYTNATGADNTYLGRQAGVLSTGSLNVMVGVDAGFNSTGNSNTFVGAGVGGGIAAGASMTTGSKNTLIGGYNGNQGGLDIRTASNYIVLSDGDGNPLISTADNQTVALEGAVPNSGTGITFPATQSASSNANTLDDYEEGTWTPNVGGTATYSAQKGLYTRVGRVVNIIYDITITTIGTGSTSTISGLPFAPNNSLGDMARTGGPCVSWFAGLSSSVVYLGGGIDSTASNIYLASLTAAGTGLNATATVMTSGTRIAGTLTYQTA
jgi:trimeric autotransporter adhesin